MERDETQAQGQDDASELRPEELEAQEAVDLPDREAMSLIMAEPNVRLIAWEPGDPVPPPAQ